MLLKLIDQMIGLVERIGDEIQIARISLMKLEHIYYKKDSLYENTKRLLHNKPAKLKEVYFMEKPSREEVQDLVVKICKHCPKKEKMRAILLQCYHHAIHNRIREAKDLLMKGQFSQIIHRQPVINKIHYNRAIIQIGLAYFRLGLFDEANDILIECQTPRLKDSLAQLNFQGYGNRQDKPYEMEEREI